jgi:pentose-5-phosphate-3-epimerase
VYFRKQITVNGAVTSANLDLLVDDGAAVFVNGVQVFAQNMGGGTSYAAFASAAVDDQFVHADLNTVPFVQGVNTIAVELKNASSGSPDLTFALALNLLVDPNVPPPPPTVTVTSPNGSETLARGASEDLVWNSSGAVASVDLAYSLDSGATWTPIVSGLANVGHYTWTVPDLETTTARVRVSSSADPTVQDSSDADFAITRIVSTQVTAIPLGASWKYWDEGTDPGMMWNRIDFDDSAWSEGDAQLGYGGHGEVTRLTKTSPAQSSVLFRKQILAGDVSAAQITTLSDDGIAVYVNGALVFSKNCDRGLDFDRYASASTNNEVNTFTVPSSVFLNGVNQIAVMVKQVGGGSPDLEFDLALTLTESDVPPPPPPPAPTLTLTGPNGGELLAAGSSADLTWSNTGTVANVDLAYSLDSGGTYAWTVPAVTTSTARVRVSATADGTVADASDADFSITQSPVTQVDAIPLGDTWKYWDSGVDPGAGWNLASFDDAGWSSGAAQLGYGGHGEVTTLTRTSPSQSSVLFRKQLSVSGAVTAAQLHVLFDDGIAVYVNGTLVYDQNCDRGLTFDRYASASTNNEEQTVDLPGSVFQDGVNQIAVMVKQVGGTSPDLAFDLSLALTVAAP